MSLSKSNVLFMACVTGLIVANLYYCQPLVPLIAEEFGISQARAGSLTYLTQGGYALGILLMIPLGDKLERKSQISITAILAAICLFLSAFVSDFLVLQIVSFALGMFSIVPQLLLPMAASLSNEQQRGKVIGTVVSGLLIGILFSRTLSGFIGQWIGYRGMFFTAGCIGVVLVVFIALLLPKDRPDFKGNISSLYTSLYTLIKQEPVLRHATIISSLAFAQFGAFWTTMVLLLANSPFNYDSAIIGSFGLIGAVGAFAAPLVGKIGHSGSASTLIQYGIVLTLLSFIVFSLSSSSLWGVIIGIILIDLGLQTVHVSNQTRIYALSAMARNRINTVYMSFSFLGTAFGSAFGLGLYNHFGWIGLCMGGISLSLISYIFFLYSKKNN
ncbi:MFS transporter [Myroides sp. LJL116]